MRLLIFAAALLAAPAMAEYSEQRELVAAADGIRTLRIDAGAGSLKITGSAAVDAIVVEAFIHVDGISERKGPDYIGQRLQLTLEASGEYADLVAGFRPRLFGSRGQGRVDLEVQVPERMDVRIDDGSGFIRVADVLGHVEIDDGSGVIELSNTGSVQIDDGSGDIVLRAIGGDVFVEDGSGSLSISGVAGSVRIDDGSGSIDVSDVESDLVIIDNGSGSVEFRNISGSVEIDD